MSPCKAASASCSTQSWCCFVHVQKYSFLHTFPCIALGRRKKWRVKLFDRTSARGFEPKRWISFWLDNFKATLCCFVPLNHHRHFFFSFLWRPCISNMSWSRAGMKEGGEAENRGTDITFQGAVEKNCYSITGTRNARKLSSSLSSHWCCPLCPPALSSAHCGPAYTINQLNVWVWISMRIIFRFWIGWIVKVVHCFFMCLCFWHIIWFVSAMLLMQWVTTW